MADQGAGVTAKPARDSSARKIRPTMPRARWRAGSSDMTLMPRNLESVYPRTWAITNTDFQSSPHRFSSRKEAAV